MVGKYVIVQCNCGEFVIARAIRKTKKCPKCGRRIRLDFSKLRIWASTHSAEMARELRGRCLRWDRKVPRVSRLREAI